MSYNYEHDCPFDVFITKLGKYNEGEQKQMGEWAKFPTTPEEVQNIFSRIGIRTKDDFGTTYEK